MLKIADPYLYKERNRYEAFYTHGSTASCRTGARFLLRRGSGCRKQGWRDCDKRNDRDPFCRNGDHGGAAGQELRRRGGDVPHVEKHGGSIHVLRDLRGRDERHAHQRRGICAQRTGGAISRHTNRGNEARKRRDGGEKEPDSRRHSVRRGDAVYEQGHIVDDGGLFDGAAVGAVSGAGEAVVGQACDGGHDHRRQALFFDGGHLHSR